MDVLACDIQASLLILCTIDRILQQHPTLNTTHSNRDCALPIFSILLQRFYLAALQKKRGNAPVSCIV